ncbi:MAG: hypothetical protein M0Z48_13480 [Nitrospiraceae bacterium]|nr:hypothetical protein [Nitrospiraceae bacterium]
MEKSKANIVLSPGMPNANVIVEKQLEDRLTDLQKETGADVLTLVSPIFGGLEEYLRDSIEEIENKKKKLAIVLETTGGYIEVVQRMVDTIRHNYRLVEFIIPNSAMSAGTVFAMSGDEIYMDYFSILGPIDPQIEKGDGFIPALGYLIQYERLIRKSQNGGLSLAEMSYLVERFDPAELYAYEQAKELSVALLKEWLVKYKFKNWKRTETRGVHVTKEMKKARAEEVANKLNDTNFWHSHGRGISMEILKRHLKLLIVDFGATIPLRDAIKAYHRLLMDYMIKRGYRAIIHTQGNLKPLIAQRG